MRTAAAALDMFRNASLAPLSMLALLVGVSMFSLLFYAPLLLQGGFGLSPKDAGLLITPMVVCITVGQHYQRPHHHAHPESEQHALSRFFC